LLKIEILKGDFFSDLSGTMHLDPSSHELSVCIRKQLDSGWANNALAIFADNIPTGSYSFVSS